MIPVFLENDGRFSIYISDISIWGNSLSVLMHMSKYNWFKTYVLRLRTFLEATGSF